MSLLELSSITLLDYLSVVDTRPKACLYLHKREPFLEPERNNQ